MKTITLLLDGVGDRTYQALGDKTPLQYANTPTLDKISQKSQCGLMTPLSEGVSLGTDLAHFLMFGYTLEEYPNRAVIDALGEEIPIDENTLVCRSSWATVEQRDGYFLKTRFVKNLSEEEIHCLIREISRTVEKYSFEFIHSYDSHGILLIKGDSLSDKISDSDPFYTNQFVMEVEPFETTRVEAHQMSYAMNKFLKENYKLLKTHSVNQKRLEKKLQPANFILTKWAGRYVSLEPFIKRSGMDGIVIAKSNIFKGLTTLVDMDFHRYNDFKKAVDVALASDKKYVHLHTKLPDEASHKKDPYLKVEAIESIDRKISKLLDHDGVLIVTADHSTPCAGDMIHSGESVPFMACGKYIRRDNVSSFNEISCGQGSVFLQAKDYMHYIQNVTDRGQLYHLRAGQKKRNYVPTKVKRLR